MFLCVDCDRLFDDDSICVNHKICRYCIESDEANAAYEEHYAPDINRPAEYELRKNVKYPRKSDRLNRKVKKRQHFSIKWRDNSIIRIRSFPGEIYMSGAHSLTYTLGKDKYVSFNRHHDYIHHAEIPEYKKRTYFKIDSNGDTLWTADTTIINITAEHYLAKRANRAKNHAARKSVENGLVEFWKTQRAHEKSIVFVAETRAKKKSSKHSAKRWIRYNKH